jgi:hypothetical protein
MAVSDMEEELEEVEDIWSGEKRATEAGMWLLMELQRIRERRQ